MGLSTWPNLELFPLEERPLLPAARLRRFGINYLQDAVCTGLGLLAHLDGSHVRLLAFSSRHGRGANGGIVADMVADIDLEAGRRNQNPDDRREKAASTLRSEGEISPAMVATSQGPARGLSWGRCSRSADAVGATSAESGGSSGVTSGPQGGGVGVRAVIGGSGPEMDGGSGRSGSRSVSNCSGVLPGDQGGGIACYLAVACGSEVFLWKVSRGRIGSSTEAGEVGSNRYSTVRVLTDWHRGSRDGGSNTGRKNTPLPAGNIRCLSFRPCGGGGSAGLSGEADVVGGDGTVPLTVWYDAGAAVLGSGGSRAVLPAPVIRERACGAWSGCGRRLAVSSGGEIRVYSDPSSENLLPMATAVASVALDQRPVKAGTVRGGCDPTVPCGRHGAQALPLATEVREGWVSADKEIQPADHRRVADSEDTFRTALCVEATMYEGGILSSPGSSPGGTPSSLSPSARQAITPPSPRGGVATSDRGGCGPVAAASGAPRTRAESAALAEDQGGGHSPPSRTASSSPVAATAVLSAESPSSWPPLIGGMRAMCPAGPLAFFGTTDGGLGLDSVLAATGSTGTSEPFSASRSRSRDDVTKRGGNGLLGAIVSTSNAARTAASDAGDGGSAEKSSRRSGFRHVLPGENWLAGSLRPQSRSGSPSRHRGPSSPESQQREMISLASPRPTECVTVVPEALVRKTADAGTALAESTVGASRAKAAPEVLDLRGKLGEGGSGIGGGSVGAGGAPATSTHPLFRLSLPGGIDPIKSSVIGTESRVSTPNAGKDTAAHVRKPWLVRVSCRNRSSGGPTVGGSSGSNGVGVKALASLPPGLASPDLLASSDDGRYVAVGSHACDLVACFRLELSSSDERSIAADEGQDTKSSSSPVADGGLAGPTSGAPPAGCGSGGRGEGKAGKGGGRQRKRRHRRAVPLCTLRLPPGYRAKGLAVSKEKRRASDRCGTGGAAGVPASDDAAGEEVAVLVLGGCPVSDANAATSASRRSSTGGGLFPAEPARRGSSSSSGSSNTSDEASYRTVLLRYSLPCAPSDAAGSDVVRCGKGPSDSSKRTSTSTSNCTQVPGGSNRACPDSAASNGRGENVGRGGAGSIGAGIAARASSPSVRAQSSAENEVGKGDGTRSEAIVLEAVAGVERRMRDRFDRIERMLVGVCGRLGVLEDAVKDRGPS